MQVKVLCGKGLERGTYAAQAMPRCFEAPLLGSGAQAQAGCGWEGDSKGDRCSTGDPWSSCWLWTLDQSGKGQGDMP